MLMSFVMYAHHEAPLVPGVFRLQALDTSHFQYKLQGHKLSTTLPSFPSTYDAPSDLPVM